MNVTLALANNDAILAVRFLLEPVSLACVTLWAWRRVPSPWRWAAVVVLPVAVFFGAVAALHFAGRRRAARWLLAVVVAYQILAYDRVGRLLSH
ncbi:DUF2568 domain-containing protein [Streptomyces sp. NPDC059679]|uniref:DUF2568 domain-containing protein n=1 Tax=Streptomyces sp. NPDC059679 TaxID=3346903 RepID=UPI0036AE4454